MKGPTFEQLCKTLATDEDYALWIGAGASMAMSKGKTPSWSKLISDLGAKVPAAKRPAAWQHLSFPDELEFLGAYMGHHEFRKALRAAIVDPLITADLDMAVMLDQSTIAARASGIVSFNIETISAVPFSIAKGGGSFNPRSYTEPGPYQFLRLRSFPGSATLPVYFPHGLLDLTGRCVMTSSEYALHSISLAVGTAVSVCLGGNLLILGMSLADKYLRDAVLTGRRWLRNVYWVGKVDEFQFREWARVAVERECVIAPSSDASPEGSSAVRTTRRSLLVSQRVPQAIHLVCANRHCELGALEVVANGLVGAAQALSEEGLHDRVECEEVLWPLEHVTLVGERQVRHGNAVLLHELHDPLALFGPAHHVVQALGDEQRFLDRRHVGDGRLRREKLLALLGTPICHAPCDLVGRSHPVR
ncbi:MAG TPA: hypothetical protein VMW56_21855 [Candidatus Margulisiibacteriota bacterium]|nr:hypothetical protein [Candidatus Margulisiibacteriota bacterium]